MLDDAKGYAFLQHEAESTLNWFKRRQVSLTPLGGGLSAGWLPSRPAQPTQSGTLGRVSSARVILAEVEC
jgi:hypothetical protein